MSGEASITTSVSSRTQNLALIAVILCFPFLGPAEAMIRTLPLDELVRSSHYIVIADVARSDEIADEILSGGFRIVRLRHELTLVEALKGSWLPEAPIVMETVKPEKGWMEDNVELPPPGSRVLLFLVRGKDGPMSPVNGIQGVWPLKDGKPLQMGLRYSVDQVRDLVKKQRTPTTHPPSRPAIGNIDEADSLRSEWKALWDNERYAGSEQTR